MKSKSVLDFFKKKRPWSKIKDTLLSWYLTPYLAKIFSVAHNFYLIDGFSGPGEFGDGEKGSPLIEIETISKSLGSSKNKNVNKELICVESNSNLFGRLVKKCGEINWVKLYNSKIEDVLPRLFETMEKDSYVFLYLDPFGIKGLPTNLVELINKRPDLKTEFLINFSSRGCYRECMRLLGSKQFDIFFEENAYLGDPDVSVERMNALLGSVEWQNISGNKQAEYLLSQYFCNNLKKSFKYVFNMPVRDFKNDQVKYRMIHCSNKSDGALLMADNMISKATMNKLSLFSLDLEGNIVDVDEKLDSILSFVPFVGNKPVRLNKVLLSFYEKEGIICETKVIKKFLRSKEQTNEILVLRYPEKSPTGRISAFWSEDNGRTIFLLRKKLFQS